MRTFNFSSSQAITSEIGHRIKRLRLAQNLGQLQLADMTQSSLSSIRRLEGKGQGSLEFVVRVAQALRAVDQFEGFFAPSLQSIAQAEQVQTLALRKRARLKARA